MMTGAVGMTGMSASTPLHGAPSAVPPGLVSARWDLAARYRGMR